MSSKPTDSEALMESSDKKEDENEEPKSSGLSKRDVISELVSLAMSEFPAMSIGCLAMFASTMSNAAVPRMVGKLLDNTSSTTSKNNNTTPFLLLVLGGSISSFLRTASLKSAEANIQTKLRSLLFQTFLLQPYPSNPDLSIMEEDIPTTAKIITTTLASLLRGTSSVLYSTVFMLNLNAKLFFVSSGIVPLIGGGAILFSKYLKQLTEQKRKMLLEAKEFAEERVQFLQCVKLNNREYDEMKEYDDLLGKGRDIVKKVNVAEGAFMGGLFGFTAAAVLGVVYAGGKSVSRGEMSSGGLTSFATYSFLLGVGTSGLMKAMSELRVGLESAKRVFDCIKCAPKKEIDSKPEVVMPVEKPTGIKFNNVSFGYSKEQLILHNIDLHFQIGKVTALIGKNGAGKTTITNLLGGILQPTSGSITITTQSGQIPLSSLNKTTQRHLIGLTSQNPSLFNSSILKNITYANTSATKSEIQHALSIVNADSFVTDLKSPVGKNGRRFSGGQCQKLSLIRTILQNPKLILILDEPMNNLDQEGEEAIVEVLRWNKKEGKKAILLITHREEILKYVDEIVVLEKGRIAESGTLDELNKKGAMVKELLENLA